MTLKPNLNSELKHKYDNNILDKINRIKFKRSFSGANVNVFISSKTYPVKKLGFLTNQNIDKFFDSPKDWVKNKLKIKEISVLRRSLINSQTELNKKNLEKAQLIALSKKEVYADIDLEKKPEKILELHKHSIPTGPTTKLKKIEITSNPKIPKIVDYTINDELTSIQAINKLYQKGFDELYLTRIFSTANIGKKISRKVVPTKWSITAIDDTLGKILIKTIAKFPASDYKLFFGGYLGNYFLTMFFPNNWSYELFEIGSEVTTDYETSFSKKNYSNCLGGYYANRLAVLEKLKSIKRTATTLVFRFITEEYYQPMGVWVVREASRLSLKKELCFNSKKEMIKYAVNFAKNNLNYDITELLTKSKILKILYEQKKLFHYF